MAAVCRRCRRRVGEFLLVFITSFLKTPRENILEYFREHGKSLCELLVVFFVDLSRKMRGSMGGVAHGGALAVISTRPERRRCSIVDQHQSNPISTCRAILWFLEEVLRFKEVLNVDSSPMKISKILFMRI